MFVKIFVALTLKHPHLNFLTNKVHINENVEEGMLDGFKLVKRGTEHLMLVIILQSEDLIYYNWYTAFRKMIWIIMK